MPEARFPADFLWGVATSAYQIEGSPLADGAGESNWHRFCRIPGAIEDGSNGDIACDHYRRAEEDVELMRTLGVHAYRFSLSWSRVLPRGRGAVNVRGLDFYDRLVDRLLGAGITPMGTLYHWDLPASLDDVGGWVNPDSPGWFADYAAVVFRRLGDRVPLWGTLNEPFMVSDAGYLRGFHAPGHRSVKETAAVSRHLLLAHGDAVRVYRGMGHGRIGLVVNLEPKHPVSERPADQAAAARADAWMNRHYLDPLFHGRWPEEMAEILGSDFRELEGAEAERIGQPVDWIGVNYYSRGLTRHDPGDLPVMAPRVPVSRGPRTAIGWEVYPEGLTETLTWVTERYGRIPLYVTENGAAFRDPEPGDGGTIDDSARVSYLRDHLRAALTALERGVDLRGYFVWSLLDNFEWQGGYGPRFGVVHVDFATQKRTPKRSALFYRDVIAGGGTLES